MTPIMAINATYVIRTDGRESSVTLLRRARSLQRRLLRCQSICLHTPHDAPKTQTRTQYARNGSTAARDRTCRRRAISGFAASGRFVTPLLHTGDEGTIGRSALDCGCGTGNNLELLDRFGRAYGFDLTAVGLKIGREAGRTRLAQASVTDVPFPSNAFDVVTSFDVLYALPDPIEQAAVRRNVPRGTSPAATSSSTSPPWIASGATTPSSAARSGATAARRSTRSADRGRLRRRTHHLHQRRRSSCRWSRSAPSALARPPGGGGCRIGHPRARRRRSTRC